MAKICELCGRKKSSGFQISHSHRKTKRIWRANIQKVKVALNNGQVIRKNVCARCIKSGKVRKVLI